MARLARIVVPGHPHHVIQRGNRNMKVFFNNQDYALYVGILKDSCANAGTEILAYCLMPNHVHLLMVPTHEDGLRAALGEAHRQYTRHVNLREGWRGHLWQERFHSFVMDEAHLLECARYIELNPVRARLVPSPEDWVWSSARSHLKGDDDQLLMARTLLDKKPDWNEFLQQNVSAPTLNRLRKHSSTGRPLGGEDFVKTVEQITGRDLQKKKPGPKGRKI